MTASVLKTHQLATDGLLGPGWLELRWFLIVVVEYELFLGCWLASGLRPHLAWWVAAASFAVFAVVALGKAIAGAHSCGCFGRLPTSPWLALLIDLIAIWALFFSRPGLVRCSAHESEVDAAQGTPAPSRASVFRLPHKRLTWLFAIWMVVSIGLGLAGLRAARSDDVPAIGHRVGDLIIVESERMVGQLFALGRYIDIGDWIARGPWLVVLYRAGCPECESMVGQSGDVGREVAAVGARTAFVSVPSGSPAASRPFGDVAWGALTEDAEWFVTTPLIVALSILYAANS